MALLGRGVRRWINQVSFVANFYDWVFYRLKFNGALAKFNQLLITLKNVDGRRLIHKLIRKQIFFKFESYFRSNWMTMIHAFLSVRFGWKANDSLLGILTRVHTSYYLRDKNWVVFHPAIQLGIVVWTDKTFNQTSINFPRVSLRGFSGEGLLNCGLRWKINNGFSSLLLELDLITSRKYVLLHCCIKQIAYRCEKYLKAQNRPSQSIYKSGLEFSPKTPTKSYMSDFFITSIPDINRNSLR